MSRAFAFLLVLVVAACSSEAKPGEGKAPAVQPGLELALPRAQPKVGEQELKVTDMAATMRFDVKGSIVKAKLTKRAEELRKILAVDGYAVSEAEVTYKRVSETREIGNKGEGASDPRAGKSYRVMRVNGVPVARPVGGTATPEELEKVVDDNDEIGVASELDAIIASKTWRSGERIVFTPDEIARVNASKARRPGADAETVTAIDMTLLSQRDGVAVFALTMGMRLEGDEGSFDFTLKGEARVDTATGHLREIGGTGAMKGTVKGMPVDGEMTMKAESRWVTAP